MSKFWSLIDRLTVTLVGLGIVANIAATSILLGLFYAATIATIWVVIAAIVVVLAVLFMLRAENGTRKLITLPERYVSWLVNGSPDLTRRESANTSYLRVKYVLVWTIGGAVTALIYGSLYVLIDTMTYYNRMEDAIYNTPSSSIGTFAVHASINVLVVSLFGIAMNELLHTTQTTSKVRRVGNWVLFGALALICAFLLTFAYDSSAPILVLIFMVLLTVAFAGGTVKKLRNGWHRDGLSTISKG